MCKAQPIATHLQRFSPSHIEGSSTSVGRPGTDILQSLRSRMLTSVSPSFFISLLVVSMRLNVGLPLGLTLSTSMSSTVLVIVVIISTSGMSIPTKPLLHQVYRYRLNCCRFPDFFISYVVSQANALYPPQHSHFSRIHLQCYAD